MIAYSFPVPRIREEKKKKLYYSIGEVFSRTAGETTTSLDECTLLYILNGEQELWYCTLLSICTLLIDGVRPVGPSILMGHNRSRIDGEGLKSRWWTNTSTNH